MIAADLVCFLNTDRYICAVSFVTKSENTRRYIVESTSDIFNKKGYAGTALSDLTDATHLSKGSIYGNFENKEAVAVAAFDYNLEQVQNLIHSKVGQYTNYKDKLLAHVEVYQNFDKPPFPDGGCPLMNTATEADDTNEVLREKAATGIFDWKHSLKNLIDKGISANEFKADTNSAAFATSVIALIEGGMMMFKATRSPELMDEVVFVLKTLIEKISLEPL